METEAPASEGTGLALADYYSWSDRPDLKFPPDVFDKPANCDAAAAFLSADTPAFFHHGVRSTIRSFAESDTCFTCHMKPN
jgi:hypothetical protein